MKKPVQWGSPKQYQKGWMEEANSNPAKLPKPRSKYCKRLKGNHVYGQWRQAVFAWSKGKASGFWERFCTACNRKETWIAPNLPGKYWRIDTSARPPGYTEL